MRMSAKVLSGLVVGSLALGLSLAQSPSRGEDPAAKSPAAKPEAKAPAKARAKPRGRLPANYGQVVDPLQKEKIYAIQDQYEPKIEALQAELKDLIAKRDGEIDALLTAEQREKVKELAAAAKARRAKAAAANGDADAGEPADSSPDAGESKEGAKTSDSSPKKSS